MNLHDEQLKELTDRGWKKNKQTIVKNYTFADFKRAFSFLQRIAAIAEEHNHHPNIFNSYNRVTLELTTHDSGCLTSKDYLLAAEIDKLEE